MDDPVAIRSYRPPADRDAVIAVMREALRDANAYFPDAPDDGNPAVIDDPSDVDRAALLVATAGERIVGTGGYRPPNGLLADEMGQISEDVAELKRMHVRPDWQGQGIGSRLFAEIQRRAADDRYRTFVLQTTKRQTAAIGFYESRGFERIGTTTVEVNGESVSLLSFRGPNARAPKR